MDPKAYARLYEGDTVDAHYFNSRLRIVLDMIQGLNQGKVLDVGCGPGVMARHLIDRKWKIVGLDLSPAMIRECVESIGLTAANFTCGSVECIPFMDGTFDVVLAMGVLEYIKEVGGAVRELARVSKKDGIVIMTMMNKISPYRIWERTVLFRWAQFRSKRMQTTSWIYSERAFRRVAEVSGLEVLDIVYYDFNLIIPPLDKKMPCKAAKINTILEPFCRNHLKWLGSGFIVKTRKK
jgi:ubiquinone/menaquinone biosynthesis C-methylase UbiE